MRDYYKEKLKALTTLRNNLFTCLIVIIGGTIGLFFADIDVVKTLPFAFVGAYFGFRVLLNLLSVNNDIEVTLEDLKNECK